MTGKHWIIVLIVLGSSYGMITGISDLRRTHKEQKNGLKLTKKC